RRGGRGAEQGEPLLGDDEGDEGAVGSEEAAQAHHGVDVAAARVRNRHQVAGRRGGRHGLRLSPLRRLRCGVRARDDGAKLSEAGEGHTLGVAFALLDVRYFFIGRSTYRRALAKAAKETAHNLIVYIIVVWRKNKTNQAGIENSKESSIRRTLPFNV
ncbi:hypothetical protein B296_00033096, partial [Ensete ventricosum]